MRRPTPDQLIKFAKSHEIAILAIAVGLTFLLTLFGPALVLGIRQSFSSREIDKTKAAAETEKTASDKEKISAGQTEIQLKAEDLNRTQNLEPQRRQSAANLAEATRRRKEAEDRYEQNTQNRRHNPDPDDLELRRRNCSDLAEQFPGQRFAGCQ